MSAPLSECASIARRGCAPGVTLIGRIGFAKLVAIVLAAFGLGPQLAGCGGAAPVMSYERSDERKQEIAMLWAQIREWRQSAGLRGVEPPRGEIIKMQGQSMAKAKRVCPDDGQPVAPPCKDVCSLAEAICENAESICGIAEELSGDPWARDKCSSAKASCKEAKEMCCSCRSGAPPP